MDDVTVLSRYISRDKLEMDQPSVKRVLAILNYRLPYLPQMMFLIFGFDKKIKYILARVVLYCHIDQILS